MESYGKLRWTTTGTTEKWKARHVPITPKRETVRSSLFLLMTISSLWEFQFAALEGGNFSYSLVTRNSSNSKQAFLVLE
jgi:hypothetical protein